MCKTFLKRPWFIAALLIIMSMVFAGIYFLIIRSLKLWIIAPAIGGVISALLIGWYYTYTFNAKMQHKLRFESSIVYVGLVMVLTPIIYYIIWLEPPTRGWGTYLATLFLAAVIESGLIYLAFFLPGKWFLTWRRKRHKKKILQHKE